MLFAVVSYIPRYMPGEERFFEGEKATQQVSQVITDTDAKVHSCVWLGDENGLIPVFLINKAKETHEHLLAWSENEPEKWFHLSYTTNKDRYAFGLIPNLEESKERNRLAYKLHKMEDPPKDTKYVFFFVPWVFTSQELGVFAIVRSQLDKAKSLRVGFMDFLDFDPNHPEKMPKPLMIGEISIKKDKIHRELLEKSLKEE